MTLRRISVKVVLLVIAVVAAEVVVRDGLQLRWSQRYQMEEFRRTGSLHAATLARAAEYGLLTRDAEELRRVAEVFRSPDDTDLMSVTFYDEEGRLVASRHWGPVAGAGVPAAVAPVDRLAVEPCGVSAHAHVDHYRFHVPVTLALESLGGPGQGEAVARSGGRGGGRASVLVARSFSGLQARAARSHRDLLAISVAMSLLAAVALMVLAWRLVEPIRRLAAATRRVSAGDFDTQVDVGARRDELGALANSFNGMTAELRGQRGLILAHNRDLERKVAERTAALALANEQLASTNRRLEALATTDALTGLGNRRRFLEALEQEGHRARRNGTAFALAMVDVDHFKAVNDVHGHEFGDRALVSVAARLRSSARVTDLVARYGGEEFVVLMPDTEADAALVAAERLRTEMAHHPMRHGGRFLHVTVSVGVCAVPPGTATSVEDLVRRADEAMYAAKAAGRNCTRLWRPGVFPGGPALGSEPTPTPEAGEGGGGGHGMDG